MSGVRSETRKLCAKLNKTYTSLCACELAVCFWSLTRRRVRDGEPPRSRGDTEIRDTEEGSDPSRRCA